ncbi:MAG TPA: S53 family peptidase [Candidatus Baltobacteraceae bacterium]|nr:S53 family peptidase [Candidatus Baltobacteraceae bacterium]
MQKSLTLACLAAAILTASCARNTASPVLPPAPAPETGAAATRSVADNAGAPRGWSATATQAIHFGLATFKLSAASRMPESQPMRVVVGLRQRNRVRAADAIRQHAIMSPAEFAAEFNPTRSQAEDVASYLREQGFKHVAIEPNNLIVTATGSASRVESAFHTTIRATHRSGGLVYGNVTPALVPEKLGKTVLAVLGLSNMYAMHTHILHTQRAFTPMTMRPSAAATPTPCLEVVNGICIGGEYSPVQYQVAYDANCSGCTTGSRTAVAVMAEGDITQVLADLRTAEATWNLPKVPYTVKKVGISSVDTSGADEWDLDTQSSTGIAQTVKALYVYDTTSLSDSDTSLEFNRWATDDLAQGGNASFGEAESLAYADGAMALDDEIFNQAAAQGQTMFASTGDNGEGCPVVAATGVPNTSVPEACYPAASPYVVAVGGTTLDTNANGQLPGTYYGEHVWVGTGGGISKWETAPYWQTNGICTLCAAGKGIADIAMCADNNGCPMDVFVGGAQTGVGGTSLASPLSMGLWARLQSHYSNTLGFVAPVYYGVYAKYEPCPLGSTGCVPSGEPGNDTAALPPDTTAPVGGFHDILIGTNGVPGSALPGWDTPTGLGSIDYRVMQTAVANSEFSGH